jgi:riboflavin kinase
VLAEKRKWQHIYMVLKLSEMGAYRRVTKVSTEFLAEKLGISQQTASRYLIELERKCWIKRDVTSEGSLVKIDELGIRELLKLYSNLKGVIETVYPPSVTLEGVVFTGFGEGAYYISKDNYRKQIAEKFGFTPFEGTLNLKLTSDYDIKTRIELEAYPAIEVEGFKSADRSYGLVKCYPAIIDNKVKGAIVIATRSHYDVSVLEIIAPIYLRKQLNLKDGHKVKVEAFTSPTATISIDKRS